ncbi:MAG: hypothetical protein HQL78_06520 [Magnetococcales bacterium]|nr:hypothetical protein [Magnetococcales bacterium]MBF0419805.1 hypothetical protein [Magnetococcales bacterium]
MDNNVKKITISPCSDPDAPALGLVEGLSIKLSEPYSESEVTVKINPYDDAHPVKENDTKSTKTMKFDFGKSNTKKIKFSHNTYRVKLESITKKTWEGQEYPYFEFLLEW